MDQPLTDRPRPWRVLAVLCVSVLLVGIDNTIVNVALPTLAAELSADTSGLQWVVDGYTLVFAALLLVGGYLGDRYGRRRMLQLGLVLYGFTSLLAATAGTTAELVTARALMGAGELIGMRWVLWDRAGQIAPAVFAGLMDIIEGALAPRPDPDAGPAPAHDA